MYLLQPDSRPVVLKSASFGLIGRMCPSLQQAAHFRFCTLNTVLNGWFFCRWSHSILFVESVNVTCCYHICRRLCFTCLHWLVALSSSSGKILVLFFIGIIFFRRTGIVNSRPHWQSTSPEAICVLFRQSPKIDNRTLHCIFYRKVLQQTPL